MTIQVQHALSQVRKLTITDFPWPESEANCSLGQVVRELEPTGAWFPDGIQRDLSLNWESNSCKLWAWHWLLNLLKL